MRSIWNRFFKKFIIFSDTHEQRLVFFSRFKKIDIHEIVVGVCNYVSCIYFFKSDVSFFSILKIEINENLSEEFILISRRSRSNEISIWNYEIGTTKSLNFSDYLVSNIRLRSTSFRGVFKSMTAYAESRGRSPTYLSQCSLQYVACCLCSAFIISTCTSICNQHNRTRCIGSQTCVYEWVFFFLIANQNSRANIYLYVDEFYSCV